MQVTDMKKGLSAMLSSWEFSSCRHWRIVRDWEKGAMGCFTNITPVAKRKMVCKWEREGRGEASQKVCAMAQARDNQESSEGR